MKNKLLYLIIFIIILQFIPYGKEHTEYKTVAEPEWYNTQTRELFFKACGDCHSFQTEWPWYSNIAPISWLIYNHVQEGREHFNVSNWGYQKKNKGEDAAEEIEQGDMPIAPYLFLHSEANLSDKYKNILIDGLKKTFAESEE